MPGPSPFSRKLSNFKLKIPKGMTKREYLKSLNSPDPGQQENIDGPTRLSKSDEDNKKVETLKYEPSKRTLPPGKSILMKAKGGRIGYKHGGAAKRGHGCEIK
jgi:hypothetical protein